REEGVKNRDLAVFAVEAACLPDIREYSTVSSCRPASDDLPEDTRADSSAVSPQLETWKPLRLCFRTAKSVFQSLKWAHFSWVAEKFRRSKWTDRRHCR
ncbi:hypothetical protein PFISCL1PPCAC_25174, partial [Pristionchus fissidentatus]